MPRPGRYVRGAPLPFSYLMRAIPTALTGLGIGLLIAAVNAFVNRGEVSPWSWVFISIIVSGLFVWLSGYFDKSRE
jgi:hypothetical protein